MVERNGWRRRPASHWSSGAGGRPAIYWRRWQRWANESHDHTDISTGVNVQQGGYLSIFSTNSSTESSCMGSPSPLARARAIFTAWEIHSKSEVKNNKRQTLETWKWRCCSATSAVLWKVLFLSIWPVMLKPSRMLRAVTTASPACGAGVVITWWPTDAAQHSSKIEYKIKECIKLKICFTTVL